MARMGIGNDGYIRTQKEVTYGTAITTAMTLLPVNSDSLVTGQVNQIENNTQLGRRLMCLPSAGRRVAGGTLSLDMYPSVIGDIFNYFLGGASSVDVTDGAYVHTWLSPDTGERVPTSFTLQQALGSELADQYAGCKVSAITIEGDNEGNISLSATIVGKDFVTDVARITSFACPTDTPFNFSFASLNIDPSGVSAFNQLMNSFSLELDLQYQVDRFKLGSNTISEPVFNSIPTATFTCNIDSDQQFIDYARGLTSADLTLTITSTEDAGTTPTKYATVVELPGCLLAEDTNAPNGDEILTMDLTFNCQFGGTTTGSSGANKMFEVRHTNQTATYTA
jgi:hypothetical protein